MQSLTSAPAVQSNERLLERLESYRRALSGRKAPLAWIDLDLLDQNAKSIAARAGSKKIRIGTKSIRSRAILDRIRSHLSPGGGFMVMTGYEAVWLTNLGYDDCVLGYPCVNRAELVEIAKAVGSGRKITLMADLEEHLRLYDSVAREAGVKLSVWLDLDASTPIPGVFFGVHRSSLQTARDIEKLLGQNPSSNWPNLDIDGLMSYEAQIAGVQDRPPAAWQAPVIGWLKRRSVSIVEARRRDAVAKMRAANLQVSKVNGGGTGSMKTTSLDREVTEMTVGSGFFSPALFDHYKDFLFHPAAGFALEVTRHSHDSIWTCLGGGYPASGTGPDRAPVPYLPPGMKLLENEGAGEVQTPVESKSHALSIGELAFFRHAKAGELCERFNELHLIQAGKVVDVVPTYRGEGKNFV